MQEANRHMFSSPGAGGSRYFSKPAPLEEVRPECVGGPGPPSLLSALPAPRVDGGTAPKSWRNPSLSMVISSQCPLTPRTPVARLWAQEMAWWALSGAVENSPGKVSSRGRGLGGGPGLWPCQALGPEGCWMYSGLQGEWGGERAF